MPSMVTRPVIANKRQDDLAELAQRRCRHETAESIVKVLQYQAWALRSS